MIFPQSVPVKCPICDYDVPLPIRHSTRLDGDALLVSLSADPSTLRRHLKSHCDATDNPLQSFVIESGTHYPHDEEHS